MTENDDDVENDETETENDINEVIIDQTKFPNAVFINQIDKNDKRKILLRI